MPTILTAGLDGSMKNFGVARILIDLPSMKMSIDDLILTSTEKDKKKQVRASSDLYRRAKEINRGVHKAIEGCAVCFAEIPSGGQSYDAVMGFGITIGTYGSIRIPLIEVSPAETKMATVGTKVASKQEMIEWAFETYPDAPWLLTKRAGKMVPTLANEHLADACAVTHAGILTPQFQQVAAILGMRPALVA